MEYFDCSLCGSGEWRVKWGQRGLKNGIADVRAFRCTSDGYGSHAQIVECETCGHVFANPRWSEEELVGAYMAVEDEEYVGMEQARQMTFDRHLAFLESLSGDPAGRRLLDVGAYTGVMVEMANKRGWRAEGLEPSSWARRQAEKKGLRMVAGEIGSVELEKKYEVVTMWDVIEHLHDPKRAVERCGEMLVDGGWLVVHTIDIDSRAAQMMGRKWPWWMDMHVQYFSKQSLVGMVERSGFEPVWAGAQGRYLRGDYLASRFEGVNKPLGKMVGGVVQTLGWSEAVLPVNWGDLITVYARRR